MHVITVIELAIGGSIYYFGNISAWLTNDYTILKLIALSPIACMPLFAQLDARSRYQNYKLLKDQLYIYGFQPRILKPFIKSRCQRDAAKTAIAELGMTGQYKIYFTGLGYKWYHLFPDAIFNDPKMLFTKNFWITTLFTKTYQSKIDFKNLKKITRFDKSKNLRLTIKSYSSF